MNTSIERAQHARLPAPYGPLLAEVREFAQPFREEAQQRNRDQFIKGAGLMRLLLWPSCTPPQEANFASRACFAARAVVAAAAQFAFSGAVGVLAGAAVGIAYLVRGREAAQRLAAEWLWPISATVMVTCLASQAALMAGLALMLRTAANGR